MAATAALVTPEIRAIRVNPRRRVFGFAFETRNPETRNCPLCPLWLKVLLLLSEVEGPAAA